MTCVIRCCVASIGRETENNAPKRLDDDGWRGGVSGSELSV